MNKIPKKSFLLRIDNELYDAIAKLAEENCRSINSEIEFILKSSISARNNSSKKQANTSAEKPSIPEKNDEQVVPEKKQTDSQGVENLSSWMESENIPD